MNKLRRGAGILGTMTIVLFSYSVMLGQGRAVERLVPVYNLADFTVEYGVKETGRIGILVKIDLNSRNVAGLNHFLRVTILDENEDPLEDTDGRFAVDGLVGTQIGIKTAKDPGLRNLRLFVPYDEIEVIGSGEQLLIMDFDVVDADGELIQHLDLHEFLFTLGEMTSNESPLDSLGIEGILTDVNIRHDVVRKSVKGIVVRFTIDQVTGLKGVDALISMRFLQSVDSDEYVQSKLPAFADDNGDLIVTMPIKAGFDPAKFSDVAMFVPSAAFPFKKGKHKVEMDIDILASLPEEILVHIGFMSVELQIK